MQKLKKPGAAHAAQQCQEMGLSVGDTIFGREVTGLEGWAEVKLTIKFIGARVVVCDVMRRTRLSPPWKPDGESANWTLNCRDWYREAPGLAETAG